MAWRSTAAAIVAAMSAALLGCASAAKAPAAQGSAPAAAAASPAPSHSAAAAPAAVRILQGAFNEDSDGARFVLSADAPLLYTAYEPRPTLFVLDLPGAELPENFKSPAASGSLVSSVRVERVSEMGRRLTRVTIAHREGLHSDVHSLGQGLAVSFEPAQAAEAPAPAPPAEAPAPAPAPPAEAPPGRLRRPAEKTSRLRPRLSPKRSRLSRPESNARIFSRRSGSGRSPEESPCRSSRTGPCRPGTSCSPTPSGSSSTCRASRMACAGVFSPWKAGSSRGSASRSSSRLRNPSLASSSISRSCCRTRSTPTESA